MTQSAPKAVILAAEEGTRLRPLTLDRPKPMLPRAGRPLLEHTLTWLRDHGITQVAINLHYRPEAIRDTLGDGHRFGVATTYFNLDQVDGVSQVFEVEVQAHEGRDAERQIAGYKALFGPYLGGEILGSNEDLVARGSGEPG